MDSLHHLGHLGGGVLSRIALTCNQEQPGPTELTKLSDDGKLISSPQKLSHSSIKHGSHPGPDHDHFTIRSCSVYLPEPMLCYTLLP